MIDGALLFGVGLLVLKPPRDGLDIGMGWLLLVAGAVVEVVTVAKWFSE